MLPSRYPSLQTGSLLGVREKREVEIQGPNPPLPLCFLVVHELAVGYQTVHENFGLIFLLFCLFVCLLVFFSFVQPEQRRSLWNAKLFPVVHPFDVLEEDAGKDDILWLASTGVSDTPDQQKLNRFVAKSRLCCVSSFVFCVLLLCYIALCLSYVVG